MVETLELDFDKSEIKKSSGKKQVKKAVRGATKKKKSEYPECDPNTNWSEQDDCTACGKLVEMSGGKLNCKRGRCYSKTGADAWKVDKEVDILFLGESPGDVEAKLGDFFVGPSGRELGDWINECQLNNYNIYVDNVVRCSLHQDISDVSTVNRKKLISKCKYWLSKELNRIRPKVIVTLGNVALQALTDITGITKWVGNVLLHSELKAWIIPAFHPSAILRGNRNDWRQESLESLQKAKEYCENPVKVKPRKAVFVTDKIVFDKMYSEMSAADVIVADFETHGFDPALPETEIIGLSLCCDESIGYFVPFMGIEDDKWKLGTKFWQGDQIERVRKLLEDQSKRKVFHNAAFDLLWIRYSGWDCWPIWDTIIGSSVLEFVDNGLKDLAWIYTDFAGYESNLDAYIKTSKTSFTVIPPDELAKYGALDGIATFLLYKAFQKKAKKFKLDGLINELCELRYYLTDMEYQGCLVDLERIAHLQGMYEGRINDHIARVRAITKNPELNLNSPTQMIKVFWGDDEKKGMFSLNEFGKRIKPSTDKDAIEMIMEKYQKAKTKSGKEKLEFMQRFTDFRRDSKKKTTYLDAFADNNIKGRVHPWFKIWDTKTGRLSSNLQQVPRGDEIRGVFVAPPGSVLVEFDYSQLEIRIIGQYSRDKDFCGLLNRGGDVHASVGQGFIKQPDGSDYEIEKFYSGELRAKAKIINFSIIYGKMAESLAEELGISVMDAYKLLERYFKKYSSLKKWIDQQHSFAIQNGYVMTLTGRKLKFSGFNFSDEYDRAAVCRRAVNWPVQSAANDCVVHGINRVERGIRKNRMPVQSVLTVHDSIMYEVQDGVVDEFLPMAKEQLEIGIPQVDMIKLFVDCKIGERWGDLEKRKI